MTTHAERMARADRHLQELQSFLMAEIEDAITDAEQALAREIARGNRYCIEYDREHLERLKAKRAKWQAEWGPVPPYPKCGEDGA